MGTTATGRRRNRSWPKALKREIVAASLAPGASVSMVARHYDVNANQVFDWRKRYRDEPDVLADRSVPQLIPVMVTAEQDAVAKQACFGESAEKPLRQRPCFQSNPLKVVGGVRQHLQQRFGFARHLHFPHDLTGTIHNE